MIDIVYNFILYIVNLLYPFYSICESHTVVKTGYAQGNIDDVIRNIFVWSLVKQ